MIVRVKATVTVDVYIDYDEYEVSRHLGGEPLWDVGLAICRDFDDPGADPDVENPFRVVTAVYEFEPTDGEPVKRLFPEEDDLC